MTDFLCDSLHLTKLTRLRLSGDVVHRPRLLNQLQSSSTLTLVIVFEYRQSGSLDEMDGEEVQA